MSRTTSREIIADFCLRNDLSVKDILGPSRMRYVAWPRQELMYEIYTRCPHLSLPAIGRVLGGRDHTTILHGIRAHCEREGVLYESRGSGGKQIPPRHGMTAQQYRDRVRLRPMPAKEAA